MATYYVVLDVVVGLFAFTEWKLLKHRRNRLNHMEKLADIEAEDDYSYFRALNIKA